MIGHFPVQRPDENLYSLACQYKKRFQPRSDRAVSRDLFGVEIVHDIVDLPCRLRYLAGQIPEEFGITVDSLINQTTAFPYFSPFLAPQRYADALRAMKEQISDYRAFFTCFRKGPNMSPRFLRLCVECAIEGRRHGEGTYWQRSHQIPCIHICDCHRIALAYTSIPRGKALTSNYISADDVFQNCPIAVSLQTRALDTLLWLSQQVQWLLKHPQPCLDQECLRNVYLYRLYEAGFASISGCVRMSELSLAVSKKYKRTGLSGLLNIQFTQDHATQWLRRVLGGDASSAEHLMALHFLEMPVSSLIEIIASPIWFEPGPWPCLNPLCRRFGKNVIKSHDLTIISRKMIGTFRCECGYAYQRIGPDRKGDHRHTPYRSVPNSVWDEVVRRMCARTGLSLTAIRDQLFTSYSELKRALMRLGIDANVRVEEFESHGGSACPPIIDRLPNCEKQRERKRRHFLQWRREHPLATRSEIRNGISTTVRWLQEHDPEWLRAHMPAKSPSPANTKFF